jgi:hypothetical protein
MNVLYKVGADDVLGVNFSAAQEAISYIQQSWDLTKEKPFESLENMLNPALKYIDVVNDKSNLEQQIHAFFFTHLLTQSPVHPNLISLFNYLHKNYGSALSKVKRLLKDLSQSPSIMESFTPTNPKSSVTLVSNLVWPSQLYNPLLMKQIQLHPDLVDHHSYF